MKARRVLDGKRSRHLRGATAARVHLLHCGHLHGLVHGGVGRQHGWAAGQQRSPWPTVSSCKLQRTVGEHRKTMYLFSSYDIIRPVVFYRNSLLCAHLLFIVNSAVCMETWFIYTRQYLLKIVENIETLLKCSVPTLKQFSVLGLGLCECFHHTAHREV